jgi:DNA repair protein SbcD/Mre11
MRIIVLGDPHFGGGYALGRIDPYRQVNTRLLDHSMTFDKVIDFAVEHGVDHVVLTGDIYEHRRPEASQMAVFSEKLARLSELGIHTHMVAGNHDIVRAHKATTMDKFRLLKLPMVHVYNDIGSYRCQDGSGKGANLVFLPFRTRQMLQCWSNEDAIAFLKDRLDHEVQDLGNDDPNILVGHLALQGSRQHGGELEEHTIFDIVLPLSMFGEFDAVLMGHIHPFQLLSENPLVAHVGSMERTDFGEAGQPKVFAFIEIVGGKLAWEFVPLPVKPLCDLSIDKSTEQPSGLMDGIFQWIRDYGSRHMLANSIARIEVTVGESAAHAVDTAEIMRFMMQEMRVSHCVGVHAVVLSKRQLRDSTITEKTDKRAAFVKWLELNVGDAVLRDEMRKAGFGIMDGRGNG